MQAILRARVGVTGAARWKSGAAVALHHAENFLAETTPGDDPAQLEEGSSAAENAIDTGLLMAMGGLQLGDKVNTEVGTAPDGGLDSSESDEDDDDMGLRQQHLGQCKRVVIIESEEDDGGDDDEDDAILLCDGDGCNGAWHMHCLTPPRVCRLGPNSRHCVFVASTGGTRDPCPAGLPAQGRGARF